MTELDNLLAEASKRACEAVVLSTLRQVHLLVEGSLRPFSNRALSTQEIVDLLMEVAPATVSTSLEGDCELTFTFRAALGQVDVKVDKKSDFIFARIAVPRAAAPSRVSRTPLSPFEGLDLDLSGIAEAASAVPAPIPPPARPAPPPARPVPAAAPQAKPAQPGAAPIKGVFPKPFGCEVELEVGTFSHQKPELAELGVPDVEPDFGTGRDFQMDAAADEPLELDTSDHSAGPGVQVNREALTPAGLSSPVPAALSVEELVDDVLVPAAGAAPAVPQPAPVRDSPIPPDRRPLVSSSAVAAPLQRHLRTLVDNNGSDLHLAPGSPPRIRVRGELVGVGDTLLTPTDLEAMFEQVLDADQKQRWKKDFALDFSLDVLGIGRFRANAFRQRKGLNLVFRSIAPRIPTLAELGLPPAAERLTTFPNGLILVTGPAGCGKSTTQAAIVDRINETWHDHVITVEDPIEFVHPVKHCLVNQREVGTHVRTFAEALRSALREDPDVILVGELRDLETIQLAITAAETGHLVLGTLHTIDAARTVDRLVDVFPGEQKLQMRSMVSESLRGVISQRLLPAAEGNGRVAAFELLLSDRSISNLIREGKTFQIANILKTSKAKGMVAMDDSIIALARARKITVEVALQNMERPEDLTKLLKQLGPTGFLAPPGPARPGAPAAGGVANAPASARAKSAPAPVPVPGRKS
ncbi:MAG: type IV pilus twitching motility protein PilT [Myxococcales bacterium]